jgi:hypothetical protein
MYVCGNQNLGLCSLHSIGIIVLKGVGDRVLSCLGALGMAWAIGNFKVLWLESFLRYRVVKTLCLCTFSLLWFNLINK